MTPGKMASQAGHAYLGAFLETQRSNSVQAAEYASESPGTKVCLQGSLPQILKAHAQAKALGVPFFVVIDSGCQNFFEGAPTLTAFGFGPATDEQVKPITKKLKLL